MSAVSGLGGCSALGLSSPVTCELDAARERRLETETEAQLVIGQSQRMKAGTDNEFQVLMANGKTGKPAVIVLHGPGRSAADRLPQQLMIGLNDLGYTLAVPQMPVQLRTCEGPNTYPQTFARAFERIDHLQKVLADQGHLRPILIGSWLADAYLAQRPRARLRAWIVPNLTGGFSWIEQPELPVLDVYGERANVMTLNAASRRRLALERFGRSRQAQVAGADMEFSGRYDELVRLIDSFLAENERAWLSGSGLDTR